MLSFDSGPTVKLGTARLLHVKATDYLKVLQSYQVYAVACPEWSIGGH